MRLRHLTLPSLIVLSAVACRSTESSAPPYSPSDASAEKSEPAAPKNPLAESVRATPSNANYTGVQGAGAEVASTHIEAGDALRDGFDLQGARQQYRLALQADPGNPTATERLRAVGAMLGESGASGQDFLEDAAQREIVRRAEARQAADQERLDAEAAMSKGNYDVAIQKYRKALIILSYHPLIAEGSLDEQLIRARLDTAQNQRAEAAVAEEARLRSEAETLRMARETEERNRRDNRLERLYSEAYSAFSAENYRRAEDLAKQILLVDPSNGYATEMRDIAAAARHQRTSEVNARDLKEQWLRTFEDLETMSLPQSDSIVFDDIRRWREVSERTPIEFSAADTDVQSNNQAILDRLDRVQTQATFGVDGEGAPLNEVARHLQQVTGVNFLISARVRDELDEDETAVLLELPKRSVRKILDLISETSESLRWKVEDGVVKFVTIDEMVGGQVLVMYEARDLIQPPANFPGRDINVSPSGGLEPPDEDYEEREALVVTGDGLDALIRDNVAPESWDADPANSLRITESGTLVVNQTPEVHKQIQALLDDLREATGIMVDIQARFITVEDNFLEDIGVDFRGLGAPGLGTNSFLNDFGDATAQQELGQEIGQGTDLGAFYDDGEDGEALARVENLYDTGLGDENVLTGSGGLSFQWTYINDLEMELILRAVSKSERIELVTAPNILVFNTARANLTVLNQVAYVQDYDVEIAQSASIADPIIAVIEDGVILDVRPVVSADRRFVTLEVRPTVAQLQRPIREVSTSLGTGGEVTIQLPEVEISRVRTSVPMPDGGTVLLGGLKIHESQQYRSGVPILSQIPILSLLFERKGTYQTNRKLLILLKAKIVIPSENEPTPAQLGLTSSSYSR